MNFLKILLGSLSLSGFAVADAQESVAPLRENPVVRDRAMVKEKTAGKPTALSLPFFEDFTGSDPYPDAGRWSDKQVYVNNTMGRNMISRGVATFDALNERGTVYYDTIEAYTQIYADSLSSLPIDLGIYTPADSVYLSFFYQPRGYGFSPKPNDSLMLFFLASNGTWRQVWAVGGDTLQPFRQVMVPVLDTGYFNSNFRMRWVNKATLGISNSHWNLDYIRMDEGRNRNDTTIVHDLAFTRDPASVLNDFSAMPFRHFKTNPASFLENGLTATVRPNVVTATASYPVHYTARVAGNGTALGSGTVSTGTIPARQESNVSFPMYNAGAYNTPGANDRVVYEHIFYQEDAPVLSDNDTIRFNQVFDNYFAYDDGTAEQSYFLNLLPNAPGYTAVEYALYAPDTIRGVAIRFAQQLPLQSNKEFAIAVYRDIAVNGGSDQLVYQEDFLYPMYEDSVNKLSVYTFAQPVRMDAGAFYIAIIQAAGGTSDSLQIALDANRTGGNHRYFRVESAWQPSLIDGALLLRPLVGAVLPVGIAGAVPVQPDWNISPNPASNTVRISMPALKQAKARYRIMDIQGRSMQEGTFRDNELLDIHGLPAGMYFIRATTEAGTLQPLKLLKR